MKRLLMNKFIIGLICALFTLPVLAQEDELKSLAGYVDFGDLSATYGEPKITINLGGTMLNFVGMMSSSESPETSDLISKLKGIRVQIYSLDGGTDAARDQFGSRDKWSTRSRSLCSTSPTMWRESEGSDTGMTATLCLVNMLSSLLTNIRSIRMP